MTQVLSALHHALEAKYETLSQGGWVIAFADAECLFPVVEALNDLAEKLPQHPELADIAFALVRLIRDGQVGMNMRALLEVTRGETVAHFGIGLSASSITLGIEMRVIELPEDPDGDQDLFVCLSPTGGFQKRKVTRWANRLKAAVETDQVQLIELWFSK